MPHRNNLFILTGGPGAGKTTLIEALSGRGFAVSQEVGRRIIREQLATGGSGLPWADRAAFAARMLDYEIDNYHALCDHAGPVFFDRGIPDILGYLALEGLEITERASKAARLLRYNPSVFILPPWRAIYETDAERKQDFAVATATCEAMITAYRQCGYDPVTVPTGPVDSRIDFILQTVGRQ